MIQRKQTVYLILSGVIALLALALDMGTYTDGKVMNFSNEIVKGHPHRWLAFSSAALAIIVGLLSFYTISMFKERKKQLKTVKFAIIMNVLWILTNSLWVYLHYSAGEGEGFQATWWSILPLITLIGLILADRGIKADEALIKSMDRIR